MGTRSVFVKSLAAASANNIAQSQNGSAGVALNLNGTASTFLSTTTTAAVAAGLLVVPLTSVTGLIAGQAVTDSTAPTAIATNTRIQGVGASGVTIWPPVAGPGIGSGDTMVFPGTATIDSVTTTNVGALGRRVAIAYTGSDTSFTIVGTNGTGNVITDVAVGASGAAQSNLDFVTVTSITPVGGGLTGVTAGTNGVGSSPWTAWNWRGYSPMSLSTAVELVSGSVNYTVQYTYDDPNNLVAGAAFPLTFNDPVLNAASATGEALIEGAIVASRVLINSGTGVLRCRFEQAGAG